MSSEEKNQTKPFELKFTRLQKINFEIFQNSIPKDIVNMQMEMDKGYSEIKDNNKEIQVNINIRIKINSKNEDDEIKIASIDIAYTGIFYFENEFNKNTLPDVYSALYFYTKSAIDNIFLMSMLAPPILPTPDFKDTKL